MLCRILLSVALASTVIVTAPTIAAACGNAMFVDGDDAVKQVTEAERLLNIGKLKKAQDKVNPHTYRFDEEGVQKRANIVWASAVFRLDNQTAESWQVKNAIATLENAQESDKDNPVLIARLAEGYAFGADSRDKALLTLEDLAARDLMPDAFGYRTLAQLRAGAGNTEAANAALEVCKTMTKRTDVCTLATKKVDLEKVRKNAPARSRARGVRRGS